jgi:hypothetical protein
MAIIRLATVPKLGNDGFWISKLSIIETVKTVTNSSNVSKRSLVVDSHDVECFEMVFVGESTDKKGITIKTAIFGTNVNPNPTGETRVGTKKITLYNKFTSVLLQLGVVDKEILDKARKDINVLDVDTIASLFLAIKDLPVKVKLQKNDKGFLEPNLLTLTVTGEMQ